MNRNDYSKEVISISTKNQSGTFELSNKLELNEYYRYIKIWQTG